MTRAPDAAEYGIIDIKLIDATNRLRPVDPIAVDSLAKDIEQNGLLQPILVEAGGLIDGGYRLIAGAHRLEAFAVSGGTHIPAMIYPASKGYVALEKEIAENLRRNELNPIDRAVFLHAWREMLEDEGRVHQQGRPSKNGKGAETAVFSFADYASDQLSLKERSIYDILKVCDIPREDLVRLRDLPAPLPQIDLIKIARLYNKAAPRESRALQSRVVDGLLKTPATKVQEIIAGLVETKPTQTSELAIWEKLAGKVRALSISDQTRFFEEMSGLIEVWQTGRDLNATNPVKSK
jgi:ParB family chromosome partitioning protein